MKPLLRLLVILLSIAIVVMALLPPEKEATASKPEPTPSPGVEAVPGSESQKMIRDLLGGASIDSGQKAKDTISEVNQQRAKDFEESGL